MRFRLSKRLGFDSSVLGIGIAILMGSILGTISILFSPLWTLAAVLGAFGTALIFRAPELVIGFLLLFPSAIVPREYNFFIHLLVGRFQLTDLILILAFLVLLVRLITERDFGWANTELDVPLLLYLGAVALGVVTSVLHYEIEFSVTTPEARHMSGWVSFFAVTNLVRSEARIKRLVYSLLGAGILVAAIVLIMRFSGISLSAGGGGTGQADGLIRSFHPGLSATQISLVTLTSIMLLGERDRVHLSLLPILLLLGAALLTTLARHLVVSISIILILSVLILRAEEFSNLVRVGLYTTLLISILGAATILSQEGSILLEYVAAYGDRITDTLVLQGSPSDQNLAYRVYETRHALAHVGAHPILGIGLENPYRPPLYPSDQGLTFIHNSYLWIWLKTGILGLLPFLWFLIGLIVYGLKEWRNISDPLLRATGLGLTLAFVGLAFSNLVAPFFVQDWGSAMFGVAAGIIMSIRNLNDGGSE